MRKSASIVPRGGLKYIDYTSSGTRANYDPSLRDMLLSGVVKQPLDYGEDHTQSPSVDQPLSAAPFEAEKGTA